MKVADNLLDILLAPLQRFGRLGAYGLILTANGIVTVIGASAFATVVAEPNMIVFGSSLGSIVAVVLAVLVLVSPSLRDNKDVGEHEVLGDWHILLKASWSITAGQIFAAAIANLPTWIVSFLGTSEDVARFAGAAYLLTIGSIIGSALNVSFVSEYRLLVARGKLGQLVGRLRRSVLLLIISSGVVMVLGGVAGPKFFELVYGQEFSYSSWFIAGLSLAAVLNVGTHVMNAALLAVNLYNRQLAIVLVSLVCGVSVSFLSYPHIGSALWTGAVAGIVASIAKFLLSVGTVVSISRS